MPPAGCHPAQQGTDRMKLTKGLVLALLLATATPVLADAATDAAFTRIRDIWAAEGRTDAPHISASLWYALGDGAQERLYDYGYSYMKIFGEEVGTMMASMLATSTPESLRNAVETLESLGCDELFLVPSTADVTELDRTRDALGI